MSVYMELDKGDLTNNTVLFLLNLKKKVSTLGKHELEIAESTITKIKTAPIKFSELDSYLLCLHIIEEMEQLITINKNMRAQ